MRVVGFFENEKNEKRIFGVVEKEEKGERERENHVPGRSWKSSLCRSSLGHKTRDCLGGSGPLS